MPVRVYLEDTDAQGIVYYVNYLKMMERARTEWLRSFGFNQSETMVSDLIFVVHSIALKYHHSAKLDDELIIETEIESFSRVRLTFKQRVRRQKIVLCDGEIQVACIRQSDLKPVKLPESLKQQLTQ